MLDGVPLARVLHRRAYVLGHLLARFEESAADLRRARELFSGSGDQVWEARVLNLQALVDVRLGEVESAAEAFAHFGEISAALGDLGSDVAVAEHNTGLAGLPPRRPAAGARAVRRRRGALRRARHDQRRPRPRPGGGLLVRRARPGRARRRRGRPRRPTAAAARARPTCWWRSPVPPSPRATGTGPCRPPTRARRSCARSPGTSTGWRPTSSSIIARDRAGAPPRPAAAPGRACRRRDARGAGAPAAPGPPRSAQVWRAASGPRAPPASRRAGSPRRRPTVARPPVPSGRSAGWRRPGAREPAGDSGGVLRACERGLRGTRRAPGHARQPGAAGRVRRPRCGPGRARHAHRDGPR